MAIVDASGDVENGYTYDVYGEPTVTGSLGNEFDFAGQQTDPSTGLQYLRARYYDPVSGTFLSRDPLAVDPDWIAHPFAYANNTPANVSDPTGLFSPLPPCVISGSCFCKITRDCGESESWTEKCRNSPLGGPCLAPPDERPTWISVDDIALVGEYLVIGGVKHWKVKNKSGGTTEIQSGDAARDGKAVFDSLAKRNGATPTYDAASGRWQFRTKSHGLTVSFRFDVSGNATVHIQNPRGGEFKLKFVQRRP